MTWPCCTGEGPSRRLARRLSGTAASLAPGAALMLLPKCPLCLAAWLTVATGLGVSAGAAARVRGLIAIFWVVALTLAAAQIIQRIWRSRWASTSGQAAWWRSSPESTRPLLRSRRRNPAVELLGPGAE